jgi:hypothetical protein
MFVCHCSYVVEQAVKEAVAAGYDPEVIDLISLKPFDQSAITVRGTNDDSTGTSFSTRTAITSLHALRATELCEEDAPCHHR